MENLPWELYDMDADRVELNNQAAAQPERVKAMSARWEAWAKRTLAGADVGQVVRLVAFDDEDLLQMEDLDGIVAVLAAHGVGTGP